MSAREKNTRALYGKLTVKPCVSEPDKEAFDTLTVNRADDGDLVEALARRGYDVTCTWVTPEVLARRGAAMEKKRAARAKRGTP